MTHTHSDHAPAANILGRELDVPTYGFTSGGGFTPTVRLADGAGVDVGSDSLTAIHTPGHTADHLCYQLDEFLFAGDHIMGGSTVIIEDAAAYMESLEKVAALSPSRIFPGHGPELPEAGDVIAEFIAHRIERERQVLEAIQSGARCISDVVDVVYAGVDPNLRIAAVFQVHTQLLKLRDEGRVSLGSGGAHGATSVWLVEKP